MSKCIKCGAEIPDGELFCQECSLNAGSTMFEEAKASRYKAPPGHMQTPEPAAHVRIESGESHSRKKRKKNSRGLKIAFALVSLMLVCVLAFVGTQYGKLRQAKTRLRTKEADVALRLAEVDDLEARLADVTGQLTLANEALAEKEAEILELMDRLADSQSNQSQGEYDLDQTEAQLQRLQAENLELLALVDELKDQQMELRNEYHSLETESLKLGEKAEFMDDYVVFVQNDGSGLYHSYDCPQFKQRDFWAYSRSLADFEGYKPCPHCQEKPEE